MSFAARAQGTHARLRAHFGSWSVTIRAGSAPGASEMTITSRTPIPAMMGGEGRTTLSNGTEVVDLQIEFDHTDPGRTFVPRPGHWATMPDGEEYSIVSVTPHEADSTISYRCRLRGTQ